MKTAQALQKVTKGFTLIELLVVIAVIGVLAGAIIVAINPTEQLARGRDAGRKSTAQQVADAINAYYTTTSGMPVTSGFLGALTASGDLKAIPAAPNAPLCASVAGSVTSQNGFCYVVLGAPGSQNQFAEYVMLESIASRSQASCTAAQSAFYLYSSADAKAGVVCATPTGPTTTGGFTYF